MRIDALRGPAALRAFDDPGFLDRWDRLARRTPWISTFQSPAFCLPWYTAYAPRFEPLLICAIDSGELHGLMPLALENGRLCHAGDHQCEYQGWLADADLAPDFLTTAIHAAFEASSASPWYWANASPGLPIDQFDQVVDGGTAQLTTTSSPCPLLDVTDAAFLEGKARGRLRTHRNHLERRGMTYERVIDPARAREVLARMATWCDMRQGAAHDVMPFASDPAKLSFHQLLLDRPGTFWLSALWLGDNLLAAHVGPFDGNELAMGVQAYDPREARRSPGAILLLELAADVQRSGGTTIDLTPGGDPWKERFASHHRSVNELTLRRGRLAAVAADAGRAFETGARALLRGIGADPGRLRERLASVAGGNIGDRGERLVEIHSWPEASPELEVGSDNLDRLIVDAAADLDNTDSCRLLGQAARFLSEGWTPWPRLSDGDLVALAWTPPEEGWVDLEGPSGPRCRRDQAESGAARLPPDVLLVVPTATRQQPTGEATIELMAGIAAASAHHGPVWAWLTRQEAKTLSQWVADLDRERRAG